MLKIVFSVALALASGLLIIWCLLLRKVDQDELMTAAYNKLFDNRAEIEMRQKKERQRGELLEELNEPLRTLMRVFFGKGNEKKIRKLVEESEEIRHGDFSALGIIDLPGYALITRADTIEYGNLHKNMLAKCKELYGRKYGENKTKQLIARMTSYGILGVALALIFGSLCAAGGDLSQAAMVTLLCMALTAAIVYAFYNDVDSKLRKRHEAIARQFPNVVSKLALLVTSGKIVSDAWKETAESSNLDIYTEMQITSHELDNLVDPTVAYTDFIDRCNTKETTKLASAIIQNLTKGNAEIGNLLKNMAHESWQERRHMAKRDSEKANSKLMIPTMMLFIAILMMIMVPMVLNFSGMLS